MTDPRIAEARRLRVDPGMSRAQLAKHFGVGNGTLTEWLRGIQPPEWTRRPTAKDAVRKRAVELRVLGWSVNDLAKELGVSKSTAYVWVQHLPLDPDADRARAKRAHADLMHAARWAGHRERRDTMRAGVHHAAVAEVGPVDARDLAILGAAIYWCEGSKSKPWSPRERLTFINSDPGLLGLFLAFVEAWGRPRAGLTYRVHIHETADAEEAGDWWAERLSLPREMFRRPTIKRHIPSTKRMNTGSDYHGCLVIDVPRSRELYWRVEGIMNALTAGRD
jgi:transposase